MPGNACAPPRLGAALRALPILLLLALPACSARRPAGDAVPPLASAALEEWAAWGHVVVEGWPELRPADTAATEARFGRLLDYWRLVPGREGVAQRHLRVRHNLLAPRAGEEVTADSLMAGGAPAPAAGPVPGTEDIGIYARPAWSAAFITAVARRAFLPESDLPSTDRHASYIDAILSAWMTDPEHAAFQPFAIGEHVPRPGDLLCADRSAVPLAHWSERMAEMGRPRPMHCDVVTGSRRGVVEAVGGNVSDLVVLRRLPADGAGHVLPAPFGQPVLLMILAARR